MLVPPPPVFADFMTPTDQRAFDISFAADIAAAEPSGTTIVSFTTPTISPSDMTLLSSTLDAAQTGVIVKTTGGTPGAPYSAYLVTLSVTYTSGTILTRSIVIGVVSPLG